MNCVSFTINFLTKVLIQPAPILHITSLFPFQSSLLSPLRSLPPTPSLPLSLPHLSDQSMELICQLVSLIAEFIKLALKSPLLKPQSLLAPVPVDAARYIIVSIRIGLPYLT